MSKGAAAALTLVLIAFAVITVNKQRGRAPDGQADTLSGSTIAARESVLRFWESYRAATNHRIAGRHDEAIVAYRQALALDDRHEDALYYVGNLYLDAGHYADAESAWMRLLAVNPQSARAHSQLGVLYSCFPESDRFDLDRAAVETRRALDINQEETGPLLQLGQIALLRNDLASASRYFDQVLASNFKSVEAYYLRGYVAWKEGAHENAAAWFGNAVNAARPAEAAHGVVGEGDTKPGVASLSGESTRCDVIPVPVSALAVHTGRSSHDMLGHYRRLDAQLAQARE